MAFAQVYCGFVVVLRIMVGTVVAGRIFFFSPNWQHGGSTYLRQSSSVTPNPTSNLIMDTGDAGDSKCDRFKPLLAPTSETIPVR